MKYFENTKQLISDYLLSYLKTRANDFKAINNWGADVCQRLEEFLLNGKMIRGGLVILAYSMFNNSNIDSSSDVVALAAATELFQSAFLIHDDIMDRDANRRGLVSIYHQYKNLNENSNANDSLHFGESMGICVGDIAFFLAFDILSALNIPKLIAVSSKEITGVGLAQMQDVYFGYSDTIPTEDDIMNVYLYKTARYTFSLPLSLGAILAEQDDDIIQSLEHFGDTMGVLFQLKDDELGLFADTADIGKTVGVDIIEGKKTLYYLYLMEASDSEQQTRLNSIFGNPNTSVDDIDFVITAMQELGIKKRIADKMQQLADESRTILKSLAIPDKYRSVLDELLVYSLNRKK